MGGDGVPLTVEPKGTELWICLYLRRQGNIFCFILFFKSHITNLVGLLSLSHLFVSLFLSELCWELVIFFDTCEIFGAGCIFLGFGSYYYTGMFFLIILFYKLVFIVGIRPNSIWVWSLFIKHESLSLIYLASCLV